MESSLNLFEQDNSEEMAKDPAFLFFPGDWLGGTMTFSRAHKGAYMDLLMCQFNQGHMALQDIHIVLGEGDFTNMWETKLKAKFIQDENGLFYNQKLEDEIIKRKLFTKSRRDNLNGTSHMDPLMGAHKNNLVAKRMESVNENRDLNKIINVSFEEFWSLYDKKVGEKGKLIKKWEALKDADRLAIIAYLPKYKIATPNKKYRKDPSTFLNNKSWNDEIITDNAQQTNGKKFNGNNGHALQPGGQDPTRISSEGIGSL